MHRMSYFRRRVSASLACIGLLGTSVVFAAGQTLPASAGATPAGVERVASETKAGERDIHQWLARMHDASRKRSYVGTFVVSSADGSMASSRIWHACDGEQQMERIESLTGTPRSVFRRNDQVITFLPQSRIAKIEKRDALDVFHHLGRAGKSDMADYYTARLLGDERVAGFDADVVLLQPRDALRFGYKVWSEKKTGLVITLQTLAPDGKVLEQAAFSELDMDVPVKVDKLTQLMSKTAGYKVVKPELVRTTALHEGWQLKTAVAGFQPVGCYKRPLQPMGGSSPRGTQPDPHMQWTFSDGLATVSLFVEAFDAQRHTQERELAMGATQMVMQRVGADWWLTAVGEVPLPTLRMFAQSLERRKTGPN
jgi:sigma-E factor negative regulatory protein RseB